MPDIRIYKHIGVVILLTLVGVGGERGIYLNGHGCKDEKIGEVENKGGEKEGKLVLFRSGSRLQRM